MSAISLAMTRVSLGVSAMAGVSPAKPIRPTRATLDSSLRTIFLPVLSCRCRRRVGWGAAGRNYARKAAALAMHSWPAPRQDLLEGAIAVLVIPSASGGGRGL